MTAPLMPYSITFFPSIASPYMYVDLGQRGSWSNAYYRHRLGHGTYMVQAAYFSTGRRLDLRENSSRLYRFESGQTGWLKSPMFQIVVLEEGEALLDLLSSSSSDSGSDEKAALMVYPMETYKP